MTPLRGCSCCDRSTTRAELRERHGTPRDFARAVQAAVGREISQSEADWAIILYRREYTQAPEGQP